MVSLLIFCPVDFLEVGCDIPVGESFSGQGEDDFIDVFESTGSFGHDGRFKGAVAVAGDFDVDGANGVGEHGFGAVAVSGVLACLVGVFGVFGVAEVVGEFFVKGSLDDVLGEGLE